MNSSRGPRFGRTSLQVEHLEDRTVPATPTTPTIPEQVNAGLIMADRLIVTANPTTAALLKSTPLARDVMSIGFGMYSVRLKAGTDLSGAISYYGSLSGVTRAEVDGIRRPTQLSNDTFNDALYGPSKIHAPTAWNVTTGNPNFIVGVLDSGVDYTHPDLAANIWTNPGEIAGNNIDDDGNGFVDDIHGWDFADNDNDPMDFDGHGTHVAGTIGAIGNNNLGVTGINWNVKIMALRFIGPFGGAVSDEVAAINYSIMMGAKVTNNSYGGLGFFPAEAAAIAATHAAGQIYVASAGNDAVDNDLNPYYPTNFTTSFNNVISVAATDNQDKLADFSQYGATTVTLAAPGVRILSTAPGNGYQYLDGTSMASPHVAGAIALYWGANPTLTYQQVIAKLKSSVDKLPQLDGKVSTGGRLNVAKMFGASPVTTVVVNAPVGSDVVRVLGTGGATRLSLTPHAGFLGGVEAASGDVNGDGVDDVVTAATWGGHVKVFDGDTGAELKSFYAFAGYLGPINVAVGDMTGDGVGDIIVAANLNGHVKVFDGITGLLTFSEFVYSGYFGTVEVSSVDIDGDGRDELLTAADAGAGVHVKAFQAGTLAQQDSFYATPPGNPWPDFNISAGTLDTDGRVLLVSQGPRVRVLDSRTKALRADFLAFDPLLKGPVSVEVGRLTGGSSSQLVAILESGGQAQVRVFDSTSFTLTDQFVAGTR
jgi:subtilisin family serine protease